MRRIAIPLVLAVLLGAATIVQNEPRNVRLTVEDTDSGIVRWVQPQQANQVNPPITGYEWQVAVDGAPGDSGTTSAAERSARYHAPGGACEATVTLTARVRAINPAAAWDPGPWGTSAAVQRVNPPCPVVAPVAPSVDVEVDTVAGTTSPPFPVDLALVDLTCRIQGTQVWVTAEIAGDLSLGAWFPVERLMSGTAVVETRDYSISAFAYGADNAGEYWSGWGGSQEVQVPPRPDVYPVRITSGFTSVPANPAVSYQVDAGGDVTEPDETNNASIVACSPVAM